MVLGPVYSPVGFGTVVWAFAAEINPLEAAARTNALSNWVNRICIILTLIIFSIISDIAV
jgi:hypothetical protein